MAEEDSRVSHPEGKVYGVGCVCVCICTVYASTACICMHMYTLNMQMFVCACVHVCPGSEANVSGQTRTQQLGVLAPWPLGGGASMDTLVLGTCRVTVRLSCSEEGHVLLL